MYKQSSEQKGLHQAKDTEGNTFFMNIHSFVVPTPQLCWLFVESHMDCGGEGMYV